MIARRFVCINAFTVRLADSFAQLFIGVVVALPLVALRLAYGVASLMLDLNTSPSHFTTSLAIKVCLSVVPEMLVTILFLAVGVSTRNIWVVSGRWRRMKESGRNVQVTVDL